MTTFADARQLERMDEQDRDDEIYRPLKDDGSDTTHLTTGGDPMTDTAQADRIAELRQELRAAAERFVARIREAEPAAQELADLEARLRVAENLAGIRDPRPPARELAVEVLRGRLACLRPYLPFVTTESADRAQECLLQVDERKLRTVQ